MRIASIVLVLSGSVMLAACTEQRVTPDERNGVEVREAPPAGFLPTLALAREATSPELPNGTHEIGRPVAGKFGHVDVTEGGKDEKFHAPANEWPLDPNKSGGIEIKFGAASNATVRAHVTSALAQTDCEAVTLGSGVAIFVPGSYQVLDAQSRTHSLVVEGTTQYWLVKGTTLPFAPEDLPILITPRAEGPMSGPDLCNSQQPGDAFYQIDPQAK